MNETVRDLLARDAAADIAEAMGGPEGIAQALGYKSVRSGRRIRNGHRSNPLYKHREALMRADDPWPMVRGDLVIAVLRQMQDEHGPLTEKKVQAIWADLEQQEAVSDGEEDVQTIRHHHDRASLGDLKQAVGAHARDQLERLALIHLCELHGWDPRAGR